MFQRLPYRFFKIADPGVTQVKHILLIQYEPLDDVPQNTVWKTCGAYWKWSNCILNSDKYVTSQWRVLIPRICTSMSRFWSCLQAQSHVNHYMSHSCTRPSLLYLEKKSSIIDAIVTQVRSLASFQALAIANDSFTECVSGSFMEMLTSMLTICINNRFGKGF